MKRSGFASGLIVLCVLSMGLLIVLPNGVVLVTSLLTRTSDGGVTLPWTLQHYRQLLSVYFLKVFARSAGLSAAAAGLCLLVGYPFTFALVQVRQKQHRTTLLFLAILPFLTHSLLRLYGLRALLSRHGAINSVLGWMGFEPCRFLYGAPCVVIGLVYLLLPFMVLPLYGSMVRLDRAQLEASRDLGASGFQTFFYVIFPLTLPAVVSGLVMVFLPAMTLFYVTDLLGGAQHPMVGNVIKTHCLTLQDWPSGAATSLVLVGGVGALLYGHALLERWLCARYGVQTPTSFLGGGLDDVQ